MAERSVVARVVENPYLSAFVALGLVVMIVLQGCPARTESLREPGRLVTGLEIERELADATAEYEALLKKAELANQDLDRQYAVRQKALDFVGGLATMAAEGSKPFANPAGAVGGILQLVTIGLLADRNRRKNKIIKKAKTPAQG